jgi:hypothetical protein
MVKIWLASSIIGVHFCQGERPGRIRYSRWDLLAFPPLRPIGCARLNSLVCGCVLCSGLDRGRFAYIPARAAGCRALPASPRSAARRRKYRLLPSPCPDDGVARSLEIAFSEGREGIFPAREHTQATGVNVQTRIEARPGCEGSVSRTLP